MISNDLDIKYLKDQLGLVSRDLPIYIDYFIEFTALEHQAEKYPKKENEEFWERHTQAFDRMNQTLEGLKEEFHEKDEKISKLKDKTHKLKDQIRSYEQML